MDISELSDDGNDITEILSEVAKGPSKTMKLEFGRNEPANEKPVVSESLELKLQQEPRAPSSPAASTSQHGAFAVLGVDSSYRFQDDETDGENSVVDPEIQEIIEATVVVDEHRDRRWIEQAAKDLIASTAQEASIVVEIDQPRKKRRIYFCTFLFFGLLLIGISLWFTLRKAESVGDTEPFIPTHADRVKRIKEVVSTVAEVPTPEYRYPLPPNATFREQALSFLIDEDPLELYADVPRILQRYIMFIVVKAYSKVDPFEHADDAVLTNECGWIQGATCTDQVLVSLVLSIQPTESPRLTTIPPEIGYLTTLFILSFDYVWADGGIPSSIRQLEQLRHFALRDAPGTTSPYPFELFENRTGLIDLSFERTQFTGSLPSDMNIMWPELQRLRLGGSGVLSGTIPDSLGLMTTLTSLSFEKTYLQGPLPAVLKWPNIIAIHLAQNSLSGTLPSKIDSWTSLDTLNVGGNFFSGTIPGSLASLPKLRSLGVMNTQLTGTMPLCNSSLPHFDQFRDIIANCESVECPCCSVCCTANSTFWLCNDFVPRVLNTTDSRV